MAQRLELPMLDRAASWPERVALDAPDGTWTYAELLAASAAVSAALRGRSDDLAEARVAYLVEPGGAHVATLWGIWRAGGIGVPLALSHPEAELEHVLTDAGCAALVVDAPHVGRVRPLADALKIRMLDAPARPPGATGARDIEVDPQGARDPADGTSDRDTNSERSAPNRDDARRALILYTSGTTGKPKGVVHTHGSVRAQVEMLVGAWGWSGDDRTLLALPLHHVHGLINVVLCALWSGARCDVLPRFDADATWSCIEAGELTVFMAVPTVYARLIAAFDEATPERQARMRTGCRRMRLMVSGSAALPVPTLERWRVISGHLLLERYGMTELGMALSNPLQGERRAGFVGAPLPGVEVRLVDDGGDAVPAGTPGEIEVRGRAVFREYWERPADTRAAFHDGWFRTGDVAIVEDGAYRILGRRSVDILKVGGYKVSALEIEDVLRTHPAVADCAVVGVPDDELGERIAAAVIPRTDQCVEPEPVRAWLRARLAPYKVPSRVRSVEALPRNAMGKVTKPAVRALFDADDADQAALERDDVEGTTP